MNLFHANSFGRFVASEIAETIVAKYPEITLLNTVIHDRSDYLSCIGEGLGLVEMTGKSLSDRRASAEIKSLVAEVCCGD